MVGGISKLDDVQFEKICRDIKSLGKLKVLRFYHMGEPFLHTGLPDMITRAKELDLADRIEVTSNGSALTPKTCEKVIKSGLDYLRLSIYAMDPKRHEHITQTQIHPDRIRQNIRTLYEKRKEMGVDHPFIYVKMIDPFDEKENQLLFESYSDIADEVVIEPPMNWTDEVDLVGNAYGKPIERKRMHEKEVCPSPFYTLVIHSSGHVSVCCVDWEKKTCVGNIFQESLSDIWHGEKLKDFQRMHIERRKHENEACRNCTFMYTLPDNIDEITDFDALYKDQK